MPRRKSTEGASLLQGFITRDRRKESAREANQHLGDLEQTHADVILEGAGEDGAGTAAEAGVFVLEDMFSDQSQFEAVLHTLRALLGSGQPQEAQQLTEDIIRMFSKRGTDRRGPSAGSTHTFSCMLLHFSMCEQKFTQA